MSKTTETMWCVFDKDGQPLHHTLEYEKLSAEVSVFFNGSCEVKQVKVTIETIEE